LFSAIVASQFETVEIAETGETIPTTALDQSLMSRSLARGAVLAVHVEGGKRNGYGVRVDVTGTEGDLRLSDEASYSDDKDGFLEGARGDGQPMAELPIPDRLRWFPRSVLGGSVLELANLYAAFAKDLPDLPGGNTCC